MDYKTQCGCIVVDSPPFHKIKYCPLHYSASELYEANKRYDIAIGQAIMCLAKGNSLEDAVRNILLPAQEQGREALAKAEEK